MQFSIKTLLIIQAVVAMLCYIGGQINLLLFFCLILFPFTWLVPIICATVRVAGHNRRDNLLFYRSQRSKQHQQRVPVDPAQFLEVVRASRLVTKEQFDAFQHSYSTEEWETLHGDSSVAAEALMDQHLITHWQADLLLAGKYKGFLLNKYKLLKLQGSGCMSSVYLAENVDSLKQVALKILPKSKSDNSAALGRFIREAQLAGRMDHPRFIQAHDIDQSGDTHYMVLDYEPGMDLWRHVRSSGPLDCVTAVKYLAQATDGVERLHRMGMVHRDLKPDHLYLSEAHGIKILGLRMVRDLDEIRGSTAEFLTFDFESDDFLAPELAFAPEQVGPPTDIYSLGCVLYFLISNRCPYRDLDFMPQGIRSHQLNQQSNVETMRLHQTAPIPSIEPYLKNAPQPDRLTAIYERMMAKSPADRYPEAGILFKDLEDYLHDVGESVD